MSCFFYGTLMSDAVLTSVLCRSSGPKGQIAAKLATLRFRPAVIKGYKRYSVKGAPYPGLLPTGNDADRVLGMLCEGLTESDIYRLDRFEGSDYSRVNVAVETFENIDDPSSKLTVSTGVYVWTSPQNQLEEFEWDYEAFLQKDMRNFVNADLAQG